MVISKSSLHNGEMRWSAINSDTDWDLYGERMTLELYRSMIGKIKSNTPPPEQFAPFVTSEFWAGGMPYLSIAHYSDGNGKAVPGAVRELFIDGNRLKAKGVLHKGRLGEAVWKSLKRDELNYKNDVDADRIRISIAFLDLAHKHGEGGKVFIRNSITDVCPDCQRGVGEKIYVDGYLVHLALTTVPVNPRTLMEAEDIDMARKSKPATRKDDAVAILGDAELAEEVEVAALEAKSELGDALVEMSDAPEEEVVEEVAPVEPEPAVEEPEEPEVVEAVPQEELKSIVKSLLEEMLPKKSEPEVDTVSTSPAVEKSALEVSIDKLYNVVNGVTTKSGTVESKLQEVQPVLEEVGQAILEVVKSSTPSTETAPVQTNDAVLEAITALSQQVKEQGTELATLRAQLAQPNTQNNRVPVPRSISPEVVKSAPEQPSNSMSIREISRRSVGL